MPTENTIDQYNLAYIAGLFDGDGHVSLYSRKNSQGHIGTVGIAQVDRNVLEDVTVQTGGLGRTYIEPRLSGVRTVYRWRTPPRDALLFIELVFPYLKAKRIPAALLADYFYKVQRIPLTTHGKHERYSLGKFYSAAIIDVNRRPHDESFAVDDTQPNWAYLAGLFDAEGTISVPKSTVGDYYNKPTASMGMTDLRVMEWVERFTGIGRVRKSHPPTSQKRNARPMYVWLVPADTLIRFLTAIIPYLRVKQRRAELALELVRTTRMNRAVIAKEILRLNHENGNLRHHARSSITL